MAMTRAEYNRRAYDKRVANKKQCPECDQLRAIHARGLCMPCYRRQLASLTPDVLLDQQLRTRYRITLERYREMLEEQGGACAFCLRPASDFKKALGVDHDHACCSQSRKSCGKCVRWLLCDPCNRAVGLFGDNPVTLERAAALLRRRALEA